MTSRRFPRYSSGIAAAMVFLGAPAAAGATPIYGLSADSLDAFEAYANEAGTSCNQTQNTTESSLFKDMTSVCGEKISAVRLPVDWDAFKTWSSQSHACVGSQSADGSALINSVKLAVADGLSPMIDVARAYYPDQSGDPNIPDLQQASCGFQGMLAALNANQIGNLPIEPYNEPDGGMCANVAGGIFWNDQTLDSQAGRSDTLVAGAFKEGDDPVSGGSSDCGHPTGDWYIKDYLAELQTLGVSPAIFSLHTYGDTTRDYNGSVAPVQLNDTTGYLNQHLGYSPAIWVTETGAELTDPTPDSACPAEGQVPAGQLGGCVNAQPTNQKNAANYGFVQLASSSSYASQVQRVYWFDFVANNPAFDSGLLSAAGNPRYSWCLVAGQTAQNYPTCNDVPTATSAGS